MATLFLVCAAAGGTILIGQFVLALVGFGGHDFNGDMPHDVGDIAHDLHLGSHDAQMPDQELGEHAVGHGNLSTWLFGVISFKTLTAATTFFGLAGCAANAAQMGPVAQMAIAIAAGVGAMYSVHWLVRSMRRLSEDGTLRVDRALGRQGVVYLTIPAGRSGPGKVQIKLQNRLMEYQAVTDHGEPLPTGIKIQVVGVSGSSVLEVTPWVEPKPSPAVAASA